MHLIAITEIPSPFGKTVADVEMSGDSFKKEKGKIAVEFCEKLMAEPMPDYPSDESIEEDRKEIERHLARAQIKNNAETGKMLILLFYHLNTILVCYIKLMKQWGRKMEIIIKEPFISTLHMEIVCIYMLQGMC